jgi:Secretion system C-terminal sorting domain
MKFILTVFTCVLLSPMWGQYAYYNEYMLPETGSSYSLPLITNILPHNNDLYLYGINYSTGYNANVTKVNSLGQFYDSLVRPMEIGEFRHIQVQESVIEDEGEYLWAGSGSTLTYPKEHGQIIRYDSDFHETWKYDLPDYQQTYVYASSYVGARKCPDGTFIAAGIIGYENYPGSLPGAVATDIILTKIDWNGNLLWNQTCQLTRDELFLVTQDLASLSDVMVLDNGDIYIWGTFYEQRDPFVLRFSQNGFFLDHLVWGSSTFEDGKPYPVLIGDHQFAVAYNNGISGDELNYQQQIRIGILDGILMQFNWLGTYNYVHRSNGISDFERTSDNGFVLVGCGLTPAGFDPGYMLKVNSTGEVQWYWEYMPQTSWTSMDTYDLETLPDGGFAFVGYIQDNQQYYTPWLVRTNACGELVNNGCVINGVLEEQPATEQAFAPYPNPTSGICNLKGLQDVSSIEVICAMGQLVLRTNISNGQGQVAFDLSSFSAGIYTIRLLDETGLSIGQYPIIKE